MVYLTPLIFLSSLSLIFCAIYTFFEVRIIKIFNHVWDYVVDAMINYGVEKIFGHKVLNDTRHDLLPALGKDRVMGRNFAGNGEVTMTVHFVDHIRVSIIWVWN